MSDARCYVCKTTKPLTEFWKDKTRTLGISSRCKNCQNEYWKRNLYPRLKETESYKERHRNNSSKYRTNNPEKAVAHRLSRNIETGSACEWCGAENNLHKHHPDYSKPLEVIALCVPCHEAVHHRGLLV